MCETDATLNRFRGLTPKKIRVLIEIDERAMAVNRFIGGLVQRTVGVEEYYGVDTIELAYERAGFRFDHDTVLEYAHRAAARENNLCAMVWYDAYARQYDDTGPLRKFLIARGWLKETEKRFGTLTPEEYRVIGDAAMANKDACLEDVVSAYTKCGHRAGIVAILRQELRRGNDGNAEHAARALGRALTKRERAILVRGWMRYDPRKAFEHIRKYRLTELHQLLIARVLVRTDIRLKIILAWARALKVTVTTHDLERRYHILNRPCSDTDRYRIVEVVERLAKYAERWCALLPKLYAAMREEALSNYSAKAAESWGRKCGRPLTTTELLNLVDYFNERAHRELDWAIAGRKFCLDLAVKRIAKKVGAKEGNNAKREEG